MSATGRETTVADAYPQAVIPPIERRAAWFKRHPWLGLGALLVIVDAPLVAVGSALFAVSGKADRILPVTIVAVALSALAGLLVQRRPNSKIVGAIHRLSGYRSESD